MKTLVSSKEVWPEEPAVTPHERSWFGFERQQWLVRLIRDSLSGIVVVSRAIGGSESRTGGFYAQRGL